MNKKTGTEISLVKDSTDHSATLGELAKAVVAVMTEVKGIEKNLEVGSGRSSYKGVADKDVKNIIGAAMAKNGLTIFPTGVKSNVDMVNYQESDSYGVKQKRNVFVEVETEYMLLHTSGEYVKLAGLGHGVDTQDKAAGKATTYALKYALLYAFLVPTGTIDDTDTTNSADIPAVVLAKSIQAPAATPLEIANKTALGSIVANRESIPVPPNQTSGSPVSKDARPLMTEEVFNNTKIAMIAGNADKRKRQAKDLFDSADAALQMKEEYRNELLKLVK